MMAVFPMRVWAACDGDISVGGGVVMEVILGKRTTIMSLLLIQN